MSTFLKFSDVDPTTTVIVNVAEIAHLRTDGQTIDIIFCRGGGRMTWKFPDVDSVTAIVDSICNIIEWMAKPVSPKK